MSTEELLREADANHDGCHDYPAPLCEQIACRLAAALRATQPSGRVASMQVDFDEMERLRDENARLRATPLDLEAQRAVLEILNTRKCYTRAPDGDDPNCKALSGMPCACHAEIARLRSVETAAVEALDFLRQDGGALVRGQAAIYAEGVLDAALARLEEARDGG